MDNDDLSAGLDEAEPTGLKPAEAKAISMPPALVEEIQGTPELLQALARGQLALIQDRMVRKVLSDPNATVGAYAQVHDALAKIAFGRGGGAASGAGEGAGKPGVQINIIRAARRGDAITIEGEKVVDAES